MRAIILVGGLGSRLRPVLSHVPKPMAPIAGKPFLSYLLCYLKTQGITQIIFSAYYLREQIQAYFESNYLDLPILYAIENEPLGTGGAIVNALSLVQEQQPVFVLNGDTLVKLDYRAMYQQHQSTSTKLTMALRAVADCSRYGKVVLDNENNVIAFHEKGALGPGLINAGVYLIEPDLFSNFILQRQFSIEKDFLYRYTDLLKPQTYITNDYFIDIGLPEDYARSQTEFPLLGLESR